MVVFAVFISLAAATLVFKSKRIFALQREKNDWVVDASGLIMQGIVIPLLQVALVFALCRLALPQLEGTLSIPMWLAFVLNFVVVDYAYYWNHRLFHKGFFWRIHRTHHEGDVVDVFTTSRNLLWAPIFIVYLWLNGVFVFLLGNPEPFLASVALTAALDLWRHSSFAPQPTSLLHRTLAKIFITPLEHHTHHARGMDDAFFGANFSLWDRMHGTYRPVTAWPKAYGTSDEPRSLWRRLLIP